MGASLGNVPVPVSVALIFDDKDQIETRQNGRLQFDILSCGLQVIIPASIPRYRCLQQNQCFASHEPLILLENSESAVGCTSTLPSIHLSMT